MVSILLNVIFSDRRLLKEKRKEHRKAVTRIAKMEQYEKQYELVQQTFEKMHKVCVLRKCVYGSY